jgi:hypothetical protein
MLEGSMEPRSLNRRLKKPDSDKKEAKYLGLIQSRGGILFAVDLLVCF